MKAVTLLCLLGMAASALAKSGTYSDRFDNVNLDEILGNRRLLLPYIKCVLDQGNCTAEGKELKAHIKEALEQNCAKCTEAQRRGSRRVLAHLYQKEKDYWNQLVNKYDPHHKFMQKYEKEFAALRT